LRVPLGSISSDSANEFHDDIPTHSRRLSDDQPERAGGEGRQGETDRRD
jgi:hypothetical protein